MHCKKCQCEIESCICGEVDRLFEQERELTFDDFELEQTKRHQTRMDAEPDLNE